MPLTHSSANPSGLDTMSETRPPQPAQSPRAQLSHSRALQDAATGKLQENERKRAVQLRKTLADLGPSFIKVGQALSARPDLLPATYLEVRC